MRICHAQATSRTLMGEMTEPVQHEPRLRREPRTCMPFGHYQISLVPIHANSQNMDRAVEFSKVWFH